MFEIIPVVQRRKIEFQRINIVFFSPMGNINYFLRDEIIIADEPTTALDVTVQARILELLQQLRRERGLTLLFITHDFSVIAQICDRVAVMRNGEIVESGETRSVLRDPQHDYTRRLIASVPKLGQGRDFLKQVGELYANSKPQPGAI